MLATSTGKLTHSASKLKSKSRAFFRSFAKREEPVGLTNFIIPFAAILSQKPGLKIWLKL